ncbi:uncharacterized protein LOC127001401 [Eriocheir sinensis]|uniref:uncharacterized protein LOC127001401 n=1 Tax=Eriocheir sinensis TaxID=95602 RepID=UPI0021C6E5F0|nr:uncharacterized protein LOC127001401 [Eriocheir sinensis]
MAQDPSVANTKSRMTNTSTIKRKRGPESEGCGVGGLQLLSSPAAKATRRPVLSGCLRLDVGEGNKVQGFVRGQPCTLQLDSGSSMSFVFHSQAEKLGLLTGAEEMVTANLSLWEGTDQVDLISLKEVFISLHGGLEIETDFLVLPKTLEESYDDPEVLILDVNLFRRGGLVQTFSEARAMKASSLYIRQPQQLRQRGRDKQEMEQVLTFTVRRQTQGPDLTVLIDTGSDGFYVSEKYLETMTRTESNATKVPKRVSIEIGGGRRLESEEVEVAPQDIVDFVMGEQLLYKYNAVVDYSNKTVTFTVDGEHLRLNLSLEGGAGAVRRTDEPDFTGGDFLCFLKSKDTSRMRQRERDNKTPRHDTVDVPKIHNSEVFCEFDFIGGVSMLSEDHGH